MTLRRIGPFTVSPIGLGCMNFCWAYRPPLPENDVQRLLFAALDAGVDHIDTAALYGFGVSETLIGKFIASQRSRFMLASKGGMAGETFPEGIKRVIDGRPQTIRRHCEDSLRRLKTETIDLYYLHRWDKGVPIEESVGAMADLLRAGKVRALGLSEVSAATLKRAHAEHPISAVQSEYSLWSRNVEIAVLGACREIGAALVAFSPVARGFLTGSPPDAATFDAKDIRRSMPRFAPEAYTQNLALHAACLELAREADCTPAQLALAWLLARGTLPIPGTTSVEHLHENLGAASIRLPAELITRLETLFSPGAIAGARYSAASQQEVDTEEFAPK